MQAKEYPWPVFYSQNMLKKIIDKTSNLTVLPIEVSDVKDIIIGCGVQDTIIFEPQDADPKELFGVYYQYTTSPGVYAPPDFTTLIIYNNNVSLEWQRIICCKEMVHFCEKEFEQTNTQEEVMGLLNRLLGPLSTEDYDVADLMASNDKLALYQALGILFPAAARTQAKEASNDESKTISEIARWVCLPESLVKLVLIPEWPDLFEKISGTSEH